MAHLISQPGHSHSYADAYGPQNWCVFQIGAREHYAIGRAITEVGSNCTLFTDYWHNDSWNIPLPMRIRQRKHAALGKAQVYSSNFEYLVFEMLSQAIRRRSWQQIESRNGWFQKKSCANFSRFLDSCDSAPVVFVYSYAALEILELAASRGCKTILGQIDPGPMEGRIVENLHRGAGYRIPDMPSQQYWDNWRMECDLADKIIVNSPWSYSALVEEKIDPEKLEIVPLVYSAEDCLPASISSDGLHTHNKTIHPAKATSDAGTVYTHARPLRILFLGQVILRKGILELMEAI